MISTTENKTSIGNARNILKNTGWLFLDRIVRMGLGMIVVVWIARYLGPENYGVLSYTQAYVNLFLPIASLGLDTIVIKYLVNNPKDQNHIIGTAFLLKISGGMLCFMIINLTSLIINHNEYILLILLYSAIPIIQAFDIIDLYYQSKVNSKISVISKSISFIVVALFKIILIIIDAGLYWLIFSFVLEFILSAIFLTISYRINKQKISLWKFEKGVAKNLIRESWPLIFSGLVIMIYMRTDQLILNFLEGTESVGLYTAAVRISEVWYFIPTILVQSMAPSIAEMKKNGDMQYSGKTYFLFRILSLIAILIAIPMTYLSNDIIKILYGPEYSASGIVLSIHIWSALFVFLGVARGPWLVNENLTKFSLATNGIGAVLNIFLNFVLIPKYGVIGAALGTLVAQIVASYLANGLYNRTLILFKLQSKALVTCFTLPLEIYKTVRKRKELRRLNE